MRLLHVESLEFSEFSEANRPSYVAASHRWDANSEATFQDFKNRQKTTNDGCKKVEAFARYVRENVSSIKWLWIDTCCINKESAAELSEAVNLMFEWYRSAELCIAYLADVEVAEDKSSLANSVWFNRGWTLQELLAPRTVVFVTKTWQVIGNKGGSTHAYSRSDIGSGLEEDISRITGIPEQVLHSYETSLGFNVDERLKWMEGRETTREEDMSYALYGIFGVTPGANYGERHRGARERLWEAVRKRDSLAEDQRKKIIDWLLPPDPRTNHESAHQRHEPGTGVWFLRSEQYQRWKAGSIRHLWLCGKAGCGKTVLCSTAIDDVQTYCKKAGNAGQAFFYFSFADSHKQSYEDLLRSIVVQLGFKEPGLSMLRQACEKLELPRVDDLNKILLCCIASYDEVFLHIDALDECPEGDDGRQKVLRHLEQLVLSAPRLRVLATSRDVLDVRESMAKLGAEPISIAARMVDADIQNYVSKQMSRDRRLSRLDPASKTLIEETFAQKADGM
jgi:hypothetical protein